jgi:hypothetical protein
MIILALVLLFIVTYIFLVINIGVFLWFLIDPIGFWSIFWFYTLYSTVIAVSTQLFVILISLFFKFKENVKEFGRTGIFILIIFFIVSTAVQFSPGLFLTKAIHDKYKYVEQTESYLKKGKYEKALKFAEKQFTNSRKIRNYTSGPWLMRNHFIKTKKGTRLLSNRKYQAIINYAFCLQSLGRDLDKVEELYSECETLSQKSFPGEMEYYIVPLIGRSQIYMARGEILKTELLYNELTQYFTNLKDKELSLALDMMDIYAYFSEKHGDISKAESIRSKALSIFDASDKSKTSTYYLSFILPVIKDKLNHHLFNEAKLLLDKADKIASKKKKQTIYLDYLNAKALYCELHGTAEDAERLFRKAIRLSKRKSSVEYTRQLSTLGNFYFRNQRYKEALNYYYQALDRSDRKLPQGLVSSAQTLGIIMSNYALGDKELAKNQMLEVDSIIKKQMNQYFVLLTSEEKENIALQYEKILRLSNSLYLYNTTRF